VVVEIVSKIEEKEEDGGRNPNRIVAGIKINQKVRVEVETLNPFLP